MRARLFYELKKRQLKVEEVVEVAKDDTYNERFLDLSDQIQVFGKQHHPHFILDKKVDYVITDSPFIMGFTYFDKTLPYADEMETLMMKVNSSYESINFYLHRNHEYQEFGRNQTESQSNDKALEIKKFLYKHNVQHFDVQSGEDFINLVLEKLGIE